MTDLLIVRHRLRATILRKQKRIMKLESEIRELRHEHLKANAAIKNLRKAKTDV